MLRSMFKQPKAPKPQELPKETPTPTVDQAANNAEEANRLRRRKGRRGYMLSRNDAVPPTTATKTALGQ
jgi:hypothetical protein